MLKKFAIEYLKLGWSVIPISWEGSNKKPKTPLIKWEPYQHKLPEEGELLQWWAQWPQANIGIVTGELSGIVVVDIESLESQDAYAYEFGEIHATICQTTGRENGIHLFFKHPKDGNRYITRAGVRPDMDTRGDGGYVVIAPSVHPNGKHYIWQLSPFDAPDDLMKLPIDVAELFSKEKKGTLKDPHEKEKKASGTEWVQELLKGVNEGERDQACTRLAGYYLRVFRGDMEQVLPILTMWNELNNPPLDWKEVEKCIESVAKRQGQEELGKSVGE